MHLGTYIGWLGFVYVRKSYNLNFFRFSRLTNVLEPLKLKTLKKV